MRKAYTAAQKAEAIALGVVMGAEGAAESLGMDPRTVRKWMAKAGKAPEIEAPETGWRSLLELAQAKVTTALTSGKVSPVQAATIAGIAARNIREPKAPSPDEATGEAFEIAAELFGGAVIIFKRMVARHDLDPMAFLNALADLYDDAEKMEEATVALQAYHMDHEPCRGQGDGGLVYREPCPDPVDPMEWLRGIGDPGEWYERHRAEREAEAERRIAEFAKTRAEQEQTRLDAETSALVAAAEAFLAGDAA